MTTTHEHHQKVKLAQVDGRGAVSPIPTYMKLTELVFFVTTMNSNFVYLSVFFCLIETIIIMSSLRRRPVSYGQGRVSKHISDTKIYGFRSFTLFRFPFFFFLFFCFGYHPFIQWLTFFPASYSLYVVSARKVPLVPH